MADKLGTPDVEIERQSPLRPVFQPGSHGNLEAGAGVALSEVQPDSVVQLAAWPGEEKKLIAAIAAVTGLSLPDGAGGGVAKGGKAAFGVAPGKFMAVSEDDDLAAAFADAVPAEMGTVTDLSHGRTVIRIEGSRAEWVLAKLFAIDFSPTAFPTGSARSTVHHEIFAQIQRSDAEQFDLYVFRSFARSFWKVLCHACEEVGYVVK
ncbi:sarcosine oxidase subunit gamma family protein [Aquamicrobium soli]|jgi:sarcosine oxidase subunit gamma|uniref:Sarcosine oxidase subunit gamma family protein n=1 Tax=Aquamicrobium soli TaxID=1811518 RepID=A0ABV7KFS6_9HYPH